MTGLQVKADIKKNRLLFTFSGVVTKEKMESLYTDVRFSVADLERGFDVISDFSNCRILHLNSMPPLKKIMSYLAENGLGEIVRILQEDKLSYQQVLNMGTKIQGYKPIYVSSHDEAEIKLKEVIRRNGLRIHLHNTFIEYQANNEEGKGRIEDMSTSGCSVVVSSDSFIPDVDMEITLEFTLSINSDSSESFDIKARVVRAESTLFAAEFIDLIDNEKDLILKGLLHESRQ